MPGSGERQHHAADRQEGQGNEDADATDEGDAGGYDADLQNPVVVAGDRVLGRLDRSASWSVTLGKRPELPGSHLRIRMKADRWSVMTAFMAPHHRFARARPASRKPNPRDGTGQATCSRFG